MAHRSSLIHLRNIRMVSFVVAGTSEAEQWLADLLSYIYST